MVRVLKCHNFKEQKVFSDAYEPTSIACSVSKDLVFVASSDSQVFVYSLVDDGFPQVCHFPLVSPSKELIFSDIGNYVLTKETTRKEKPGHYTARVYFNWSKPLEGEGKSSHKIKVYQIGYSVTRSYTSKPETLTAVEILSRFSVHALTRCPSTGNIAVATETAVTIYKRFVDYPFDLQRVYVVEPGFSIHKLAICEHFVAFASTTEVRVLRVTFNGQTALSYERSWSKDEFSSESKQFPSGDIFSSRVTQREVFDEQFVLWSFDQYPDTSSGQKTFWDNILASREWNECDLENSNSTPSLIELPSIKEEVPFIDYSDESCEVLGPVKVVHGHPLKVQRMLSNARNIQDVTMLYRFFEADSMKTSGDSVSELHTLQLVPIYTSDYNGSEDTSDPAFGSHYPKLSGMMCFVSSPKEGFIYNVFSKTEFLSHCTYTCDTKSVVIGENLLHAVTSQAVETYTIPLYAGVAKHARLNKPPDFNDKLEIVVPADTDETAVGSENNCDGTSQLSTGVGNSGSKFPDSGAKSQEVMAEEGIDIADFGFPVYDINILQKPCPSPSSDLCLIGVHQFTGLYSILAAGNRILLLSDTTGNTPGRHSKKGKRKSGKGNQSKDWTLHVLQAMDVVALYCTMESLTEKSESLNAEADLRLLEEQHLILRTQFQVGTVSVTRRNSLLVMLQNTVKNLGNYYARYAKEAVEEVLLYYSMADLSIESVLDQHIQGCVEVDKTKDRKFGKGLAFYLNDVFFQKNQEKKVISLPQATADKVLYIYSNADPTRLSFLILRPLIEGYTPELAVKLFIKLKKAKSYSFSTEDHLALAIVYLKICELEQAGGELSNLSKDKLVEMCVKHHYILYDKDETMSPLGQLLRRRLPKVFIKTLVSLHGRGIMTLTNAVQLLQGKDCEKHENTHLLEYLELVLNDQKGKASFKEAREILIEIYLEKLSVDTSGSKRELLKLPHYHIPKGSGHFSKRFSWLDKLPPFSGCVSEPNGCPFFKPSIPAVSPRRKRVPGPSRGHTPQLARGSAKKRAACTCCCCWETLLKLQSLLCSRHCDRDLGNFVLTSLVGRSLSGYISVTLLCLPLIGEHEKAVELLLSAEPSVVLTYAKQFFGNSHIKWQCLLNVLTQRIRDGEDTAANSDTYKEILKETLVILSKYSTPAVFFSALPKDGNFAFFLPFLVQCFKKNVAQNLSSQITSR